MDHYWTVASWPPGHVSNWAVHTCVRMPISPHAKVAMSVVKAVATSLVSHGWWPRHEPCVGTTVPRAASGQQCATCTCQYRYETFAGSATSDRWTAARSSCRSGSVSFVLGWHRCGLQCNPCTEATAQSLHCDGGRSLVPGQHHCGPWHDPHVGMAVGASRWGRITAGHGTGLALVVALPRASNKQTQQQINKF